jgi:uncharacterized lipoprotein YbaY
MSRPIVALVLAAVLAACGQSGQATPTALQAPVHSPSAAPSDPPTTHPTAPNAVTTAPAPTTVPYPIPLPTPLPSGTIRGTISYPAELTLPPDVSITIQLLEVRPKNAPSAIVHQTISPTGPGPIPFAIEYDLARIDLQWEYLISTEVHDHQGQLLFVAPWYPAPVQGHAVAVEVMLQAPLILSGTVSYPAESALPPDAVLTVQLVNQSLCGLSCLILGEQRIMPVEQSPAPFALAYNSAIIDPQWSYVVIARMDTYDDLNPQELNWWVEQPAPVVTQGPPATVDLVLAPPVAAEVTGTITYPVQPTLPPDAVLTVQILNQTGTGVFGPAVVGEQVIPLDGPGPMPFAIAYDPATIDPLWSYTVDAWISAPGRLDWRAEQLPGVLTQGHPATVEVKVEPPPAVATVTGTITYPSPPALPADAVLEIQMVNSNSC